MPLTQTSVEEGRWVEYGPITAVKHSDDTIEFKIAETDSEDIDLKNSFIRVKAKIVNADGEPLGATADVALVNFWLHALFSQIDMTLKDTLVTTSNNTYPYKAYIEHSSVLGLRANKDNSRHRCGTKMQITFLLTNTIRDIPKERSLPVKVT